MMIGEVLTFGLVLIAVGSFLYYWVTLDGLPALPFGKLFKRYISDNREYVNKYCIVCGHQKAIGWNVYQYDANTGKPAQYRWQVYCPECDRKADDSGKVTEYEYVNREYGVIPDTSPDTDKADENLPPEPMMTPHRMN